MTPDELASYQAWVDAERASVAAHFPPVTAADHAFFDALLAELDAAPSLQDYFTVLEPPYPAPMPDDDVQDEVELALDRLAARRNMIRPPAGAAGEIHLIACLISDLQLRLEEAIRDAYDADIDWPDVARLAGMSTTDVIRIATTLTDLEEPLDDEPTTA